MSAKRVRYARRDPIASDFVLVWGNPNQVIHSPELLRHVWIDLDPVDSERRRAIVLTPDRARELAAELVKAADNAEGPGHRRRPKPQEDRER
jgi:hypothetical protein